MNYPKLSTLEDDLPNSDEKVLRVRNLSKFKTNYESKMIFRFIMWRLARRLIDFVNFSIIHVSILKMFGAKIGHNVLIRKGVKVHFPWNLKIGENCWIGEEVWFINHDKITIGSNVCISQRSIICSGGHDYKSASLEYAHKPIKILDGAWVCLDAKVLPGVTIGECSVVSAGEVVLKSVPDYSMLINGTIRPIDPPK